MVPGQDLALSLPFLVFVRKNWEGRVCSELGVLVDEMKEKPSVNACGQRVEQT